MAEFKVDDCHSCSAPVIWAVTANARTMPVDAVPVRGGNIQLEDRGENATPLARVLSPAQQFGKTQLRRSHFVTCPDSKSWRRKSVRRHA